MNPIFADFNAMTESRQVRLTCQGSQDDLRAGGVLPGDWVWLTDGEMEVGARVEADNEGRTYGVPAWDTLVYLDPEPELSFPTVWSELERLLDLDGRTSKDESRVLQLLTWFLALVRSEAKEAIPPGFTEYLRAAVLRALGHYELALQEALKATASNSANEKYLYLYLELLRRTDLNRALHEAHRLVNDPSTGATVLAECVNILAIHMEKLSEQEFDEKFMMMLKWIERFQNAPGIENIRVGLLGQVHFNRGMALLRGNQIQAARGYFEKILELNPRDQVAQQALNLNHYDASARHLAEVYRARSLRAA